MGLDSYLVAKKYLSKSRGAEEASEIINLFPELPADVLEPGVTVSVTVGYWRGNRPLHRWFVDNVQEGNDDCNSYCVFKPMLVELQEWLENKRQEMHPAEFDYTKSVVETALSMPDGWDVYYESSW